MVNNRISKAITINSFLHFKLLPLLLFFVAVAVVITVIVVVVVVSAPARNTAENAAHASKPAQKISQPN